MITFWFVSLMDRPLVPASLILSFSEWLWVVMNHQHCTYKIINTLIIDCWFLHRRKDILRISVSHFSGCKILTVWIIFHQVFNLLFPHFKLHLVLTVFPTQIDFPFLVKYIIFWNAVKSPHKMLRGVNRLVPLLSSFSVFLNLPLTQSSFPFSCVKTSWWFDRTGPRNLLLPSRPSRVSAPSLNCYLPHFWAFPWQQGASERMSEKREVSSASSILSQTAVC